MNRLHFLWAILPCIVAEALVAEPVAPAPNGINLPPGYQNWPIVTLLQRPDSGTLRAVIGNEVAMSAVRQGRIQPWPDGAILGKLIWNAKIRPDWENAVVPGRFLDVEFMIKDREKFAATGGWGYARWSGKRLTPYGDDAKFEQECFSCHAQAKEHDYVFNEPAPLP
ncbi:MAG: cytochrome P460 family protein [Pseudomonadota bacterium]